MLIDSFKNLPHFGDAFPYAGESLLLFGILLILVHFNHLSLFKNKQDKNITLNGFSRTKKLQTRQFHTQTGTKTKRSFSTTPNPSYIQRFKNFKKSVMIKFVKNDKKQQEIFLVVYTTFIFLAITYMLNFNLGALTATLCLLAFVLVVYFLGYVLITFIFSLPDTYKNIIFLCVSLSYFYLGYYPYALLIFGLVIRSFFTKKSLTKSQPEAYEESDTWFRQLIKGFAIIDYHYKVEFYYFNHMRYFTGLLAAFYLKTLQLRHQHLLYTFFWTEESCKLAMLMLSFVLVFNFFVLVFIQFTIINYCNPVIIKGSTLHKVFGALTTCGAVAVGTASWHEAMVSTESNPINLPGRASYQYYTQGYACDTAKGLKAGAKYKYLFDTTPPLKEDGMTLDVKTTREHLAAFRAEGLKKDAESVGHGMAAGASTGIGHGFAKGVTTGALEGIKESSAVVPFNWLFGPLSKK